MVTCEYTPESLLQFAMELNHRTVSNRKQNDDQWSAEKCAQHHHKSNYL